MNTHGVLFALGYKLVEDAWDTDGRITYIHHDSVARSHIADLAGVLGNVGWHKNSAKLRSFTNDNGDEIEIEPGGADTSGHFLHHMKATVAISERG